SPSSAFGTFFRRREKGKAVQAQGDGKAGANLRSRFPTPDSPCPTPRLSGTLVVRSHGALLVALPVFFLERVAFVVLLLAAGEADFDLDLVAFPVHGQWHHGVALALDCADQLV